MKTLACQFYVFIYEACIYRADIHDHQSFVSPLLPKKEPQSKLLVVVIYLVTSVSTITDQIVKFSRVSLLFVVHYFYFNCCGLHFIESSSNVYGFYLHTNINTFITRITYKQLWICICTKTKEGQYPILYSSIYICSDCFIITSYYSPDYILYHNLS